MENNYLTLEKLVEEMKPFHNHIGIAMDSELVRLIGIGDDDEDFYYICLHEGGKISWYTCVGPFESLKGKIERYDILDSCFELNNCKKTKEFLIENENK